MFPVRVPLQRQQLRFDFGDQFGTLFTLGDVEQFLNDVVTKAVLHHRDQRGRIICIDLHYFVDDVLTVVVGSICNTLFNDIGGELVL